MVQSTLELISTGKKKGSAISNGLIMLHMKENSKIIILKAKDVIFGLMAESITVNGLTTKCTGMGNSHGLMENRIRV